MVMEITKIAPIAIAASFAVSLNSPLLNTLHSEAHIGNKTKAIETKSSAPIAFANYSCTTVLHPAPDDLIPAGCSRRA